MNAWEEEGDVVFDLSTAPWDAMETFFDIDKMLNHLDTGADRAGSLMRRVRLNLTTKAVDVSDWPNDLGIPLHNSIDFPMINPLYTGYKNRYAYGWAGVDYFKQHLVKKDLETSSEDKTWFRPSHYPGEVSFIPNPGKSINYRDNIHCNCLAAQIPPLRMTVSFSPLCLMGNWIYLTCCFWMGSALLC